MLLLKLNITRKKQVKKNIIKFKVNNNKGYKLKAIFHSAIYVKESVLGYLPGLYYLIL